VSQKRLFKFVLFCFDQSFFFQRIWVVKNIERIWETCRVQEDPCSIFLIAEKHLLRNYAWIRIPFLKLLRKSTKQIWESCCVQENPCSIFYLRKSTLHPDPDFCARIRILVWDCQDTEKIIENPLCAGKPLPDFLWLKKHLSKSFHPRVAPIRITSIYFGTTDREPSSEGT